MSGEGPVCYAVELGLQSAGEGTERHKQKVSETVGVVGWGVGKNLKDVLSHPWKEP